MNTDPSITQDLEYASTQEGQLGTQEGQPVSQEGTLSALYEEMYASHDHSARRLKLSFFFFFLVCTQLNFSRGLELLTNSAI